MVMANVTIMVKTVSNVLIYIMKLFSFLNSAMNGAIQIGLGKKMIARNNAKVAAGDSCIGCTSKAPDCGLH